MYRLIIVEDESPTARALQSLVPWKDIGFEVVSCFESAEGVEDYLKTGECDVILTDIVLGGESGIELSKKVFETYPHIKVIILSGYAKFSYAQKAVKYGVIDYLVKPLDEIELINTFKRIKSMLDEERIVEKEEINNGEQNIINHLCNIFLREMFNRGFFYQSEIVEDMKYLKIPKKCLNNPAVIMQFKISRDNKDSICDNDANSQFKYLLQKFLFSNSKHYIYISSINNDDTAYVAILSITKNDIHDVNVHLENKIGWLKYNAGEKYNIIITDEKKVKYEELGDCVSTQCFLDDTDKNMEKGENLLKFYSAIYMAAQQHDRTELEFTFNKLKQKAVGMPPDQCYLIFKNVFSMIIVQMCNRMPNDVSNKYLDDFLKSCKSSGNLVDDLFDNFVKQTYLITDNNNDLNKVENPVINRIILYINSHLDKDLHLEQLSEQFSINTSYMSRIFKQEVHETLNDYITRIRMQQAMKMIAKANNIQEVAQNVGYNSLSYFCVVFKKVTGYTPMLYKQLFSNKGG